jgi:hypothetical protein
MIRIGVREYEYFSDRSEQIIAKIRNEHEAMELSKVDFDLMEVDLNATRDKSIHMFNQRLEKLRIET